MKLLLILALLLGATLAEDDEDWPEPLERECPCTTSGLWLDIAVVIETSRAMTDDGLTQVLANIATVLEPTKIAQGEGQHSRLSVITYGANATTKFNLGDFKSTEDMLKRIWETTCGTGQKSNLYDALKQTQKVFEDHHLDPERRNVKTVIVVYASTFMHEHYEDPTQLANLIKISGTDIIVVGFEQHGQLDALKKLEKIATPGYFFKKTDSVAEEIQQALCMTNCFCTKMWEQYKNTYDGIEVKYGECLRVGGLDANWYPAQKACQRMGAGRGHLVNIFDIAKHNFVAQLYKNYRKFNPPYDYHIGLSYKNGSGKSGYFWDQPNGKKLIAEEDCYFEKWAPGFPDERKGKCVVAKVSSARLLKGTVTSSSELYWENEQCSTARRYICQKATCDTDNYCSIRETDQMLRFPSKE